MNNSKRRHAGGAYRHMKTMVATHARPGKDRRKARRKCHKLTGFPPHKHREEVNHV